jgi:diketogulonate reductase-like aldo/keto reductase
MKYETVHSISVPKIGFGTWGIGGDSYPDPKRDSASLTALRTALEVGYTHFDTAEVYADGHSEELLGRAIRETKAKRESLFITTKVDPGHLQYKQVLGSCENSLKRPIWTTWTYISFTGRRGLGCSLTMHSAG